MENFEENKIKDESNETTEETKPKKKTIETKITEHKPKKKVNNWKIVSAVLLVLFLVSLLSGGITGAAIFGGGIGKDNAEAKAENFINTLLRGQAIAELTESSEEYGLYKIEFSINGEETSSYLTKDGKYFFAQPLDIDEYLNMLAVTEQRQEVVPQSENIPKSDKPIVEAFVMSHCPYGTQIEKGLLPVANLLKDKIDFEIKFVYYAMHEETEVTEQLNQYCIQEEQNELFNEYLYCFLEKGNSEVCLTEVGIDTAMLEECTAATDEEFSITENLENEELWLNGRFPLFNIYKQDNEKYGIGGSPSLVINGVMSNSARDSASLLAAVCAAFNEAPEECNEELSSAAPSPGFGFNQEYSGGLGNAGCGA